jgi:5,6-dimethylbenzimidazole synthase
VVATAVARSLEVPATWLLVGYLCLGYPLEADDTPALERAGWERRRAAGDFLLRR